MYDIACVVCSEKSQRRQREFDEVVNDGASPHSQVTMRSVPNSNVSQRLSISRTLTTCDLPFRVLIKVRLSGWRRHDPLVSKYKGYLLFAALIPVPHHANVCKKVRDDRDSPTTFTLNVRSVVIGIQSRRSVICCSLAIIRNAASRHDAIRKSDCVLVYGRLDAEAPRGWWYTPANVVLHCSRPSARSL